MAVYDINEGYIFFNMQLNSFLSTIWWRDIFPLGYSFLLWSFSKCKWASNYELISGFSIDSSMYPFLCQNHTVLFMTALQHNLVSVILTYLAFPVSKMLRLLGVFYNSIQILWLLLPFLWCWYFARDCIYVNTTYAVSFSFISFLWESLLQFYSKSYSISKYMGKS